MPSTRKRTQAQPEEVPEGNGPAATSEAPPLDPPKKRQRQPRSRRMQPQPESLSEEQLEDSSQSEPLSEEQPGSSSQPSQSSGSAKRKPCVPHPLRHLTTRRTRSRIDSLFERSDFSPEQLLAIRDSANKVLLNVLATSTSSSTGNCYKKHLKRWQAYRDAIASETQTEPDYTVDSVRVIKFFNEVIFKKSARKTIDPRVGYSGAVSLAASVPEVDYDLSDDEAVGTGSEDDEELPPGRWQPATPPAGVTETECAEVQALSTTNASLSRKLEHIDIDDPTVDEHGRITFDTPLGRWTVLSCQNALVYLWKRQSATSADFPNPASSPRDDLTLQKAIEDYTTRLVYREATTGDSRKTSCSVRDPYTAEQFMRMISLTWRMIPFPQAKGKRKYDSERFPYIREHFNILARHHMLLRDEDVRNLALSDVFSTRSRHLAHGSALATGIVFSLRRGKTNQGGTNMYATAFRHRNYLRCTVAAFAFYMFERFQVEQEPLPNFSNAADWHNIRVLATGRPKERCKLRLPRGMKNGTAEDFRPARTCPISGQSQNYCTASIKTACCVYSPRNTHMGRHSGTSEAYHLGLNLDQIRLLGRWSMGQMEAYYVPKNPIIGAFYMAHFNKDNEPYFIERDSIVPPLSLQRLIFPWIESTFDNDMPDKTESWIQECDQAMLGDDPSEPKTSDVYWDPILESDVNKNLSTKLASTAVVDRIGFLKLLVRTRRVILQDAVLYLRQDALGRTLSNTLFTSKQEVRDIFESATFRSFQDDLLRKMQLYRTEPQLLNPSFQLSSHQFIEALNRSHGLAMRQNEKSQRSSDSMMDKLDQALQLLEKILTQDAERRRLDEARAIECVNTAHRHQSELLERQRLDQIYSILGQPRFLSPQQLQQSVQHERERERDRERDQLSLQQPRDQQSLQLQQAHPLQTQTQARPRPRDQPSSDISHQEQERDLSSKGYIMMRDDGKLTVQKAWDEFHGPIADAKSADKNWPYVESGRRAFRRRRQFVRLVEEIAAEKQQDIRVFVEFLTEDAKSRGLSVNQLFTEMRKTKDAREKEGEVETTESES